MRWLGLIRHAALPFALTGAIGAGVAMADDTPRLPADLVFLRDVDPTIQQDIRYATRDNFVGRRIDGYRGAECILTERAARALARVQRRMALRDLSLRVFDCYRPRRAVLHFMRWARAKEPAIKREIYHPLYAKRELFRRGFISRNSAHSRGSTVDLAIAQRRRLPSTGDQKRAGRTACHTPRGAQRDGTLDFGTSFDCFHPRSATRHRSIRDKIRENRALLVSEMARAGFRNYRKEWWHFTLRGEPHPRRVFNVPVPQHPDRRNPTEARSAD
ncbi:MAG: M15 family metallopeptidase [Pseudomonadota bacterium]